MGELPERFVSHLQGPSSKLELISVDFSSRKLKISDLFVSLSHTYVFSSVTQLKQCIFKLLLISHQALSSLAYPLNIYPKSIYWDNRTNFIGANTILKTNSFIKTTKNR